MYYYILTYAFGRTNLYKWFDHIGKIILIYALRKTNLYKWFYYTKQERMYHSTLTNALSRYNCESDLIKPFHQIKCIIPFWPMLLGRYFCTSDLIVPGCTICFISFWPIPLVKHTFTMICSHLTGSCLGFRVHNPHVKISKFIITDELSVKANTPMEISSFVQQSKIIHFLPKTQCILNLRS